MSRPTARVPTSARSSAVVAERPRADRLGRYGQQQVTAEDIEAVVEVLRSDWLTTGPKVEAFEEAVAAYVGARHAVSFSSGTAALHAAVFAAGLGPGDEAITTPLTFCATANCVLYQGATPVFADVRPDTLTIDVEEIRRRITPRTKALLPMDYAGHPADLEEIRALADRHGLVVIEDACHAFGAELRGRRIGGISHLSVFSFHPVKHITTGEGGMVTTNDAQAAKRLRMFRNHGIDRDFKSRTARGGWYYEMAALGYNYRLSDIHCALGLSQLKRIDDNLARRQAVAARYTTVLSQVPGVITPTVLPHVKPAWHLYPIRLDRPQDSGGGRDEVFAALRAEGLGVNVHYIPVHLHPYYRHRFGYRGGEYPVVESAYEQLLTLPLHHGLTDEDLHDIFQIVERVIRDGLRV